MKKIALTLVFSLVILPLYAQKMKAYQIFDAKGKKVSFKKMAKKLKSADVVLFGEFHNNPIAHWLQLEVAKHLHQELGSLAVGMEMLEADNQTAVDQYLAGEIDQATLDSTARLWSNYPTDYKPLVDFAKKHQLNVIATNIPRRYARTVARQGLEALDTLDMKDKQWIAPLPIAYDGSLPGYKAMLDMMPGHASENFPKAQAIKDATMAHFILKNKKEKQLFLHINGAYHSDNYEGILWYLKKEAPSLQFYTISMVEQEITDSLSTEAEGKADFIIVVPETMTKTYTMGF